MNYSESVRYICSVRYKGKFVIFDDTCLSHVALMNRMAKFIGRILNNNKNLGFTSFEDAIYYMIPNDNISFINFGKNYMNLFENEHFMNNEIIVELNKNLQKGLRLEDVGYDDDNKIFVK